MRILLYPLTLCFITSGLASCSSIEQPKNNQIYPDTGQAIQIKRPSCPLPTATTTTTPHKDPLAVSFYKKGALPKQPYTVLGEESISKFNLGGNKRQEAHIRDGMRELAAAMGGDAIINIKHDSKSISGTVVAYQTESPEKETKA